MEFYDVQIGFEIGALKEAIIEPGKKGDGWIIQFRDVDNGVLPLTRGGHERIFQDLDFATQLARDFGCLRISVIDE